LFVFALCLVYPMLPVSLDCLSSPYVLCTQCCQFLWIVCLRLMSCVPNVGNIGYTRHKTKTNNPEKPATLGTQDIRRRQTIQRNWQHWVHKTEGEDKQSRETGNIGYTRHKAKTNNPEKLATLGTQDIRRRQTIQKSCVPNVASFSGLFVFALCLVYPKLQVFLDCLSSPYVLCTQCCQFLWIVFLRLMSCVPNVDSFSGLFVFVLCLVYPMLPVSLDCFSSPYVLCT
jgi:ribosomal protein L33